MAPDPVHEGNASEQAALELLYALPSDATTQERWIAWIVADVCRQLGMSFPWTVATPQPRARRECRECGSPATCQGKFNLSGALTGFGYCDAHRPPSNHVGHTVPLFRSWAEFRAGTYREWRPGYPGFREQTKGRS